MPSKAKLQVKIDQLERARIEHEGSRKSRTVPESPLAFFIERLGIKPTNYQQALIEAFQKHQFTAARWSRQSGKSFTIAALLLWFALRHPTIQVAVVSPGFRQSKLIIRKITGFLTRIPKSHYHKPLRTKIAFTNGSVIEAYPNNPDTIRGPTLNLVYWDECNFTRDDEELYDAILFTLGTTNGKFICSSTPWSRDSVFWKIFNDPDYADFNRHHVTWREAQEPNGPLRQNILEKIKRQLQADPWRWRREMEAEWAEDEDAYFPQALIVRCIDPDLEYLEEKDLVANV